MLRKTRTTMLMSVTFLLLMVISPLIQAQLLANSTRTIFLDTPTSFGSASSVTYHPGFGRYYASQTGSSNSDGFVFGSGGGTPIQILATLNMDPRAWNYNTNTGLLEVSTFNASGGGAGQGIIEAQLDAGGLLTGGTATLLAAPLAGLDGNQTAPAYNAVANVLYSRSATNIVSVVSRATGAQVSTITLDFTTAGNPTVPNDGIVYVPEMQWLGVLDEVADRFAFFTLSGTFVGSSALDIDATSASSRRPGYANGQLFVYDETRGGWQGYTVFTQVATTPIPTLNSLGLALLILTFGMMAIYGIRRLF